MIRTYYGETRPTQRFHNTGRRLRRQQTESAESHHRHAPT